MWKCWGFWDRKYQGYRYLWCKVNIWNANCAPTKTLSFWKCTLLRQKMYRSEADSNPNMFIRMNRLCIIASNSILQTQPPICASVRRAANYYMMLSFQTRKNIWHNEMRLLCHSLLNAVIACSQLFIPMCHYVASFLIMLLMQRVNQDRISY